MGAAVHALVDRRGPAGAARGGDRWFVDETCFTVARHRHLPQCEALERLER
jgi:hypothetical protein